LTVTEHICGVVRWGIAILKILLSRGRSIVQISSRKAGDRLYVVASRTVKAKRTFVVRWFTEEIGDCRTVAVVAAFTRQTVINAPCFELTLISSERAWDGVLGIHRTVISRRTILRLCIVVVTVETHLAHCTLADLLGRIGESPGSGRASGHIECSFLTIVPLWASESFVLNVWLMSVGPWVADVPRSAFTDNPSSSAKLFTWTSRAVGADVHSCCFTVYPSTIKTKTS
jgi:hypothetical protein